MSRYAGNEDHNDVLVAVFRPSVPDRALLLLQWPTLYGNLMVILLLVLVWGRWMLTVMALTALALGAWRALGMQVTIREHSIKIHNQVRTHTIQVRPGHVFQPGVILSLTPSGRGVHLAWMGGALPIVVSATLTARDQQRLSEELGRLASRTGCESKVSPGSFR